jgi:hypothetical protein
VLRPDSRIVVRQTVAPLNRDLDAYGNCTPEQRRISVFASGIRDASGRSITGIDSAIEQDWFAPSQYSVMRDEQRLSAPNYELMDAGVSFGAEGVAVPADAVDQVLAPEGHETKVWEPATGHVRAYRDLVVAQGVTVSHTVRATQAGATARSLVGVAVEVDRMTMAQTTYVLVDGVDGVVVEGEPLDYVAAVTAATGDDRVVPSHVGVPA